MVTIVSRNEIGELEVTLGNSQFLSVFFGVVALLGVFFTVGYFVGKSSSPVLADSSRKAVSPLRVDSVAAPGAVTVPQVVATVATKVKDQAKPAEVTTASPKAPQNSVSASRAAEAKNQGAARPNAAEPAKTAVAESAKKEEAHADSGVQTLASRSYLQLAATSKPDADNMVGVLRQKGFSTVAVEIRERPGTWRVLVGPVADNGTTLRADLEKMGFPGNDAIRRTF